ncbi:MAG: hypothetical protein ACRDT2_11170 [Natronosporangium sp.]
MTRPDPQKPFQHVLIDVHGNYRTGRQSHQPPDELITDEVTPRALRPHVTNSTAFFAASVVLGLFIALCLFLSLLEALSTSLSGGGSSFFASLTFLLIGTLVLLLIIWFASLFVPVSEPIAEYSLLIEGRAQVAPVAYWWITQTIVQRQTPFRVSFGRSQGTPVMLLAHRRIHGLIVVQPYGADLYIGWTMWRARSTMVVVGNLIRDIFRDAGIGSVHGDVRDSVNRAMRELIHSVTREGVQAAIVEPPVALDFARAEVERLPNLDLPRVPAGAQPAAPHSQPAQAPAADQVPPVPPPAEPQQ